MEVSNEPTRVTGDQALELLRQVVAEKGPDYVYQDEHGRVLRPLEGQEGAEVCKYVNDAGTVPLCVVGYVHRKAGLPLDLFLTPVAADVIPTNQETVGESGWWFDWYTPEALEILGMAQAAQDSGRVWGDALTAAEEYAEEATA